MNVKHSRRKLLKAGLAAAGTGLGLLGTASPASAQAPCEWTLNASGAVSPLTFWLRLNLAEPAGAWKVGGGIAANAFGNPVLAYGYLLGGLNFVRVCDVDMNEVQVYRLLNGISGEYHRYRWDGSGYRRTGPYPATVTANATQPWHLTADLVPRDTQGIDQWKLKAYDGGVTYPGKLADMHYFEEPTTFARNVWGKVFGESTVGYTLQNPILIGEYAGAPQEKEKRYEAPFGFVRPLDTEFRAFQIFRGRERRAEQYYSNTYYGSYRFRRGTGFHIDTVADKQTKFKWCTNDYYTTLASHVYDDGEKTLFAWLYG